MTNCCHVYFVTIGSERKTYEDRQAYRNIVSIAAGSKMDISPAGSAVSFLVILSLEQEIRL